MRQTFTRSKSHDDFSEQSQKEGGPWRRSTRRDSRDSRRDSRGESREAQVQRASPSTCIPQDRQVSTVTNGSKASSTKRVQWKVERNRERIRELTTMGRDSRECTEEGRLRRCHCQALITEVCRFLEIVFSSSCCCPFSIKHNSYQIIFSQMNQQKKTTSMKQSKVSADIS